MSVKKIHEKQMKSNITPNNILVVIAINCHSNSIKYENKHNPKESMQYKPFD